MPVTNGGTVLTLGDRLPMINSVFRAYRYDESYSAFAGRTLTPGAHRGRAHDRGQSVRGRGPLRRPAAADRDAVLGCRQRLQRVHVLRAQGTTYLIDMQGRMVNTWATGTDPRLLDSGNVLDWATNTSGQTHSAHLVAQFLLA